MKLHVLGSGTGALSHTRGAAGYVVIASTETLLFDCGPCAVARLLANGLDPRVFNRVFLSHMHPDHCLDLVTLIFALNWTPGEVRDRPLHVAGPPGVQLFVSGLYELFPALSPRTYATAVEEWVRGEARGEGWAVRSGPVVHGDVPAVGYRVEADGKSLVYSGDTAECAEIIELARGADVLLIECSYPDGTNIYNHLTPSAAGRIAAAAGVPRVVLTHFYPPCDEVDVREQCRATYDGEILLAYDGMSLEV